MILRTSISTIFPYTTLFRSVGADIEGGLYSVTQNLANIEEQLSDVYEDEVTASCLQSDKHHLTVPRSEEHTSELQSRGHLVCRLLLEKKKKNITTKKPRTST